MDYEFKKLIIERLKRRSKVLKIDIGDIQPEDLTYEKLIELCDLLFIDHLRLLSPNYKELTHIHIDFKMDT